MLKKISRTLIVAGVQLAALVMALLLLAPLLLDSMSSILSMQGTLEKTRLISLLIRIFAYLAIFFTWPQLTKKLIKNPSVELKKQINQARFILIGALLSIEVLYWLGQL